MSDQYTSAPRLSWRFERAVRFAARLHRNQTRKGGPTPYVAHLLAVAAIAIEHGANEDEAIAALLHDAIEDQGGQQTADEIERRFGANVRHIVDACSDTDVVPKPPWRERKERYIAHLRCLDDPSPGSFAGSVRLVSMADKLHNVRSILSDYRIVGKDIWKRFTGKRKGSLWYYRALVDVYRAHDSRPLVDELDRAVTELEKLAGVRKNAG